MSVSDEGATVEGDLNKRTYTKYAAPALARTPTGTKTPIRILSVELKGSPRLGFVGPFVVFDISSWAADVVSKTSPVVKKAVVVTWSPSDVVVFIGSLVDSSG